VGRPTERETLCSSASMRPGRVCYQTASRVSMAQREMVAESGIGAVPSQRGRLSLTVERVDRTPENFWGRGAWQYAPGFRVMPVHRPDGLPTRRATTRQRMPVFTPSYRRVCPPCVRGKTKGRTLGPACFVTY
jgi:hypothetical protein